MIFSKYKQFQYEIMIFQKTNDFLVRSYTLLETMFFVKKKCNNQIFYRGWPNGGNKLVTQLWQLAKLQLGNCQLPISNCQFATSYCFSKIFLIIFFLHSAIPNKIFGCCIFLHKKHCLQKRILSFQEIA